MLESVAKTLRGGPAGSFHESIYRVRILRADLCELLALLPMQRVERVGPGYKSNIRRKRQQSERGEGGPLATKARIALGQFKRTTRSISCRPVQPRSLRRRFGALHHQAIPRSY